MRKSCKSSRTVVYIDGQCWAERELAQLIRRRMITRGTKNKKKYTRKTKHKCQS